MGGRGISECVVGVWGVGECCMSGWERISEC